MEQLPPSPTSRGEVRARFRHRGIWGGRMGRGERTAGMAMGREGGRSLPKHRPASPECNCQCQ
eukprot:1868139-Rhodomonas_salina.1